MCGFVVSVYVWFRCVRVCVCVCVSSLCLCMCMCGFVVSVYVYVHVWFRCVRVCVCASVVRCVCVYSRALFCSVLCSRQQGIIRFGRTGRTLAGHCGGVAGSCASLLLSPHSSDV